MQGTRERPGAVAEAHTDFGLVGGVSEQNAFKDRVNNNFSRTITSSFLLQHFRIDAQRDRRKTNLLLNSHLTVTIDPSECGTLPWYEIYRG